MDIYLPCCRKIVLNRHFSMGVSENAYRGRHHYSMGRRRFPWKRFPASPNEFELSVPGTNVSMWKFHGESALFIFRPMYACEKCTLFLYQTIHNTKYFIGKFIRFIEYKNRRV